MDVTAHGGPMLDSRVQATISAGALSSRMTLPGGRLRPVLLICETTNICNSDCVFCPYSTQTRSFGTMSAERFATVVEQYIVMGGGLLSLTPTVGDILLDGLLMQRLEVLDAAKSAITASVTTNLVALDRWNDAEIARLLNALSLLHISIYGVTAEENAAITRRPHYQKFVENSRRLIRIWESCARPCELKLGFRNARDHGPDRLAAFVAETFGTNIPYAATHSYANWGNSMSGKLPGDAQWVAPRVNSTPCALLATALQVYWDGRVSACACCDYDASAELSLGNIAEHTLTELYNGDAADRLWLAHLSGALPNICKQCTFHVPLESVDERHALVQSPLTFIGG